MATFNLDLEGDLARVHLKHGGVFASADLHYGEAIFGRDSLEVAEDLLWFKPEIAREVIALLAGWQGRVYNPLREEEPGKIHHEFRAAVMDGKPISARGQQILATLAERWGGTVDRLLYYGSVDATPLFVRLVVRYCQQYGNEILDYSTQHLDGSSITIRQAVLASLGWLEQALTASPWGLITFCRTNPRGHRYQVWKDSFSSYLHVDGSAANYRRPMAAIEVQGYAYDALLGASELGVALTHDELAVWRWAGLAKQLQARVIDFFWMPEQRFWAQAIDEDSFGYARQVGTLTSNAGLLLESRLLENLPIEHRIELVSGTVAGLYQANFMTEVGVRCRAWQHHRLINFADYHGCWAVWPKETYDIAKGLRRHGFVGLAEQLEWRIMNGVRLSGNCYELWYVDGEGRVAYNPGSKSSKAEPLLAENRAEMTQAWTVSAALAISQRMRQPTAEPSKAPSSWQVELEQRLLTKVAPVVLLSDASQAKREYPHYAFYIDVTTTAKRRIAALERLVG